MVRVLGIELLRSGRHELEGAVIWAFPSVSVNKQVVAEISAFISLDSPPDVASYRFVDYLERKSPLSGPEWLTEFVVSKGSEIRLR